MSLRHGSHLAVGVGSVRGEVFVGDLRGQFLVMLPIYLVWSFVVVAFERSDRYVEAAAVTVVAVLVMVYVVFLPGLGRIRLVERWAAGHEVDRARALEATYTWARGAVVRAVVGSAVCVALLLVVVGAIAGATRVAAGPVRDPGRRLGTAIALIGRAQLRGSSVAAGQGRHRR